MPQIVNLADASASLVGHPNIMKNSIRAVRKTLSVHLPTVFKPAQAAPPTSVVEILADFQTKIDHLLAVQASEKEAIAANAKQIEDLNAANARKSAHAEQAVNVAAKLKALIS